MKFAMGIVLLIASATITLSLTARPPQLTRAFLLSGGGWIPEDDGDGFILKLKRGGVYTQDYRGPGGVGCIGRYELRGRTMVLKQATAADDPQACRRRVCRLKFSRASFHRTTRLQCGKDKFWRKKSTVPAGTWRKVKGMPVRTMGAPAGELLWPMKFREAPARTAKSIDCIRDGGDRLNSVPKGKKVQVLARTEKKKRIGKYTAYWYYVAVPGSESFYCGTEMKRGWMFGAFIKLMPWKPDYRFQN